MNLAALFSDDETQQACEDCHASHDLLQVRLSADGHFRCDKCEAKDKAQFNPAVPLAGR